MAVQKSFTWPSPSAPARPGGWCHAIRTLLAFVLPSRVLSVSKVNRSPILILSGSIPADFSSLTCKNISGPPESSAINPKPRVEFHIFNFPAAILFSLFQPQLDQAADGFGPAGQILLLAAPVVELLRHIGLHAHADEIARDRGSLL